MTLALYNPLRTVDVFEKMAENLLRDTWGWEGIAPSMRGEFGMSVDMIDREGEYLITADLPGFDKKDIHVEVEGNHLIIKGERKLESEEESGSYTLRERMYGKCERVFHLPFEIDEKKMNAHYENGVLSLSVPKPKGSKTKLISIH